MLKAYPTSLPCPIISGNSMVGGESFLKTPFYHTLRVRQTFCNTYELSFKFIMSTQAQMVEFKNFYYVDLENGSLSFTANWEIEGSTMDKEFRFTERYKATALDGGMYEVSAKFELITPIKDLS